jgi:hypothetical protein
MDPLKTSLTLVHGILLIWWSNGSSVMLKKTMGYKLDLKLHVILLMEADFKMANKQIYGIHMLDNARCYLLMPDENFSERNCTVDDGSLAKMLIYDIVHQAIASVDASNCYNRIAHAIA